MENRELVGLEDFHGEIFGQIYPVSRDVISMGRGKSEEDVAELVDGLRNFLAFVGPGGIGQYTLNHPGKMHAIALGMPIGLSSTGKYGDIDNWGYNLRTLISLGELPKDIGSFVDKNTRGDVERIVVMEAERGRIGGFFHTDSRAVKTVNIELTDKVWKKGDRLMYTMASGTTQDYSACLVK